MSISFFSLIKVFLTMQDRVLLSSSKIQIPQNEKPTCESLRGTNLVKGNAILLQN